MPKLILLALTVCLFLTLSDIAHAQLFGKRILGGGLQRKVGARGRTAANLTGKERFVRGNRGKSKFVGTDSTDLSKFVGLEQATATGQVQSTIVGLRPQQDQSGVINKPFPRRKNTERYSPRLVLGFEPSRQPNNTPALLLSRRLEESASLKQLGVISVTVKARTATLTGVVASDSNRELAGILVGFDPGISAVHNGLVVSNELTMPPLPPPPSIERP